MRFNKLGLFICSLLFSSSGFAIGLSNMFLVGNDSGNGLYTLFNNESSNLYINTSISRVYLEGGEIKEEVYSKDNFLSWDITVNPSKALLRGNEAKDFSIKTLCGERCDRSKDSYYLITFAPVEGEDTEGNRDKVNLVYGFKAYYVIPATESKVEFEASLRGNVVTVNNTGNTFITGQIDQCRELKNAKGCRAQFKVLAGRKRTFEVPEQLRSQTQSLEFFNHDETVTRKVKLTDETAK